MDQAINQKQAFLKYARLAGIIVLAGLAIWLGLNAVITLRGDGINGVNPVQFMR